MIPPDVSNEAQKLFLLLRDEKFEEAINQAYQLIGCIEAHEAVEVATDNLF